MIQAPSTGLEGIEKGLFRLGQIALTFSTLENTFGSCDHSNTDVSCVKSRFFSQNL